MTAEPSSRPPLWPALSRRAALVQSLTLLGLFHGYQLAGQLLGKGASAKLEHPLLGVFLTGTLMLAPVVAFSWKDPEWRRALGLEGGDWARRAAQAVLGVLAAYGANIVMSVTYLVASGGLKQTVSQRTDFLSKLSDIPTLAIVPMVLFVGVWEETVFRGFLMGRLRVVVLGPWAASTAPHAPEAGAPVNAPAAAPVETAVPRRVDSRELVTIGLSALFFASGHAYQGVLGVLQTLMVGLVFGALTVFTRSLWPAVFAHAAIDGFGLFALKVLKPMLDRVKGGELLG